MSLPTPPLRSDGPETFADRGDAFMAALPVFESDMNALGVTVVAKEAAATASAAAALASELAANASINAALWVSGTTYAIGDVRWSPANSVSYRRRTAGAGTTDPSADATNWSPLAALIHDYIYDDRAILRTLVYAPGEMVSVEGLGIFRYTPGSTELDDDGTCFATATGCWVMVAADPDYVFGAWVVGMDDLDARTAALEAAGTTMSILRGSFAMSLTSLAAITATEFTTTVTGATPGDSVVCTPGDRFGTGADQSRLSYSAFVSLANTVTITIRNASAAAAAMSATTWRVLVVKQ